MSELKSNKNIEKKSFWLVVGFSFLIFFAQTRSFKLLLDGLTYSAISKNILSSGEWKKLHYDPVFYPDFYQHPPLAMWIQAIIYKLFGYSEPISRLFSSICSVLTVSFVFIFTKRFFGLAAGLWSSIILFTSTRFIKWGSNFYLDAILGFFALVGVCLWIQSVVEPKKDANSKLFLAFFAGFFVALAFMTKGIVMAGVLAVIPVSFIIFPSLQNIPKAFLFAFGFLAPLVIWAYFGNGLDYITKYFEYSVSSRARMNAMSIHPWRNIYLFWLPWAPFYFISIFYVVYNSVFIKISNHARILLILALYSLSFPVAFSFGNVYLEHYLTPFYPAASILAGTQFSRIKYFSKVTDAGLNYGYQFLLVVAIFIATIAPSFHVVKDLAPMKWVLEIQNLPDFERSGFKKIAFTDKAADRWYGLANILAKSDYTAIASFNLSNEAMSDTILIASREETPHQSWKQLSCFYVDGYRAYVSKNISICERQ